MTQGSTLGSVGFNFLPIYMYLVGNILFYKCICILKDLQWPKNFTSDKTRTKINWLKFCWLKLIDKKIVLIYHLNCYFCRKKIFSWLNLANRNFGRLNLGELATQPNPSPSLNITVNITYWQTNKKLYILGQCQSIDNTKKNIIQLFYITG